MPTLYDRRKQELPSIGKISAWRKEAKAKAGKRTDWDKIFFEGFGVKGEYLETFMRITGATEIYYKDSVSTMYMEGNGYQVALMPIRKKLRLSRLISIYKKSPVLTGHLIRK